MRWPFLLVLLLGSPAWGQTVAIYAATAEDPNLSAPLSTRSYVSTCGLFPKFVEAPPIEDPIEGYYDDDDSSLDCRLTFGDQFALSAGMYKTALKLGSDPYGPFSSLFSVTTPEPPPPPPPSCLYLGATYYPPDQLTIDTTRQKLDTLIATLHAAGWATTEPVRIRGNRYRFIAVCVG